MSITAVPTTSTIMDPIPLSRGQAETTDIAVIGAGIIGTACALTLARKGYRVYLLDPQQPGNGASFGNAGHIATEQVFPMASAAILRQLPRMLMDPQGPLRIDWRYLPRITPWFIRMLQNLPSVPYQNSVDGIRALNEVSLGSWRKLLSSIGQSQLMKVDGSLLVYEKPESLEALQALMARMKAEGVELDLFDAVQVQHHAGELTHRILGGLFFPQTAHVMDPHQVVIALAQESQKLGVRFIQERVTQASTVSAGVELRTPNGCLQAKQVIVACGAYSAELTHQLAGKKVPLDTERGYHLMLPHEHQRLNIPVTSLERRFIMTPMTGGLRLAGTVEFAGLNRAPNMQRAWKLLDLSRPLFDDALDDHDAAPWMGFRPSLPDSLPIIDSVQHNKVILAFGHQHLGLTQAAVTAELVADMVSSSQPAMDLGYYRLSRFG